MSEPLTEGERAIWAAAFGAYIAAHWENGPVNVVQALETARVAVQLAKAADKNPDGLFNDALPSARAMLRDMLGAGKAPVPLKCGDCDQQPPGRRTAWLCPVVGRDVHCDDRGCGKALDDEEASND